MRIKVQVTAADIKRGKRGSAESCPVARAIRRAIRPTKSISVGERCIDFDYNDGLPGHCTETPTRVWTFIGKFDDRKPVKPFIFTLSGIPAEYVRKGAK